MSQAITIVGTTRPTEVAASRNGSVGRSTPDVQREIRGTNAIAWPTVKNQVKNALSG